jgi:tetraacyldisaccharide 4'-kinase
LQLPHKPEIILLDDAFQHRKVTADLYILLTAYSDLFTDDFMLPVGNLREYKSGAQRAQAVIVSKCPVHLNEIEKNKLAQKIQNYTNAPIFFSSIVYDDYLFSANQSKPLTDCENEAVLVIAGIAKPQPFFDYLQSKIKQVSFLSFADHHDFTEKEITQIIQQANGKKIITTEKDFMRLQGKIPSEQLFYLPIQTQFLSNEKEFIKIISLNTNK